MSSESDIKAIDELRAMARVYGNHGFNDKAAQLLKLAEAMEERMHRSADRERIINMKQFRTDRDIASESEASGEQAH
jgi:hypothetical protein